METVGEVLAQGELFHALGKQWTMPPVKQKDKGHFELWMKAEALQAIREAKELGFADLQGELMDRYIAQAATASFRWMSEYSLNALKQLPGICALACILMKPKHPDITDDKVLQIRQDMLIPGSKGESTFDLILREAVRSGLPNGLMPPAMEPAAEVDQPVSAGKNTSSAI
jgi:hypothetical protein